MVVVAQVQLIGGVGIGADTFKELIIFPVRSDGA